MKFYGDDLRLKVVAARKKGFKFSEIADMFSISQASVCRYVQLYARSGSVSRKVRVYKRSITNESIMAYVDQNRDILQRDVAKYFKVSQSKISKSFKEMFLKLKKNQNLQREFVRVEFKVFCNFM
jgi:predicted transcriptional regulator